MGTRERWPGARPSRRRTRPGAPAPPGPPAADASPRIGRRGSARRSTLRGSAGRPPRRRRYHEHPEERAVGAGDRRPAEDLSRPADPRVGLSRPDEGRAAHGGSQDRAPVGGQDSGEATHRAAQPRGPCGGPLSDLCARTAPTEPRRFRARIAMPTWLYYHMEIWRPADRPHPLGGAAPPASGRGSGPAPRRGTWITWWTNR